MTTDNVQTKEGLQNTVRELVQEAVSAEMKRFQEAAAANKQSRKTSEGTELRDLRQTGGLVVVAGRLSWEPG